MLIHPVATDIREFHNLGFPIVIPTNGDINKRKECVMGRGLALQAKNKFPTLPNIIAKHIYEEGNSVAYLEELRLVIFPVKHHWNSAADLNLIEKSTMDMVEIFNNIKKYRKELNITKIYLPKVGCGNGRLNWISVKEILDKYLDDRFIVVDTK